MNVRFSYSSRLPILPACENISCKIIDEGKMVIKALLSRVGCLVVMLLNEKWIITLMDRFLIQYIHILILN